MCRLILTSAGNDRTIAIRSIAMAATDRGHVVGVVVGTTRDRRGVTGGVADTPTNRGPVVVRDVILATANDRTGVGTILKRRANWPTGSVL